MTNADQLKHTAEQVLEFGANEFTAETLMGGAYTIEQLTKELEAARKALGLHRSMVLGGEQPSEQSDAMFNQGMGVET